MKKIAIKGPIIDDQTGEFMTMFGADSYAYPSKLAKDLKDAGGDDVVLEINSPGGYTSSGAEMYTALKEYSGKIEAHIVGEADSAGSFVAMSADKVLMSPMAMMMIHRASGGNQGTSTDMQSTAQALDELDQNIVNAYVAKTGKSKEDIYQLMQKTTWMNAETAVKNGFADGLMEFDDTRSDQVQEPAFVNAAIPIPHLKDDMIEKLKAFIESQKTNDVDKPTQENTNKKITKTELVNHKLGLLFGGK
ncbi:Clp protease ClpP [Lactobacillus xujianguonis]|uniref:ATP-dependent Clp protease proteolytic subunit n=1 Tax=Lactobacillus xujianguonis TaxID=2495899 RepID=A0A437SXZ9_9LACO|nr:head maturation protease, ClpP-related [Lactobacillus xujianguonis]RVU71786.1 Clp protease ClpP [Lactobacillus xujianguonis]